MNTPVKRLEILVQGSTEKDLPESIQNCGECVIIQEWFKQRIFKEVHPITYDQFLYGQVVESSTLRGIRFCEDTLGKKYVTYDRKEYRWCLRVETADQIAKLVRAIGTIALYQSPDHLGLLVVEW